MRLLICGYFGEGNLGDDLLLTRLAERCHASIPDVEIVATWGDESPWTAPTATTIARDPETIAAHLGGFDAVIIGPGGLFHNARLAGKPNRDLGLRRLDHITASARARGIPVAAVGIGIGPLVGQAARRATARILDRCSTVTVRDQRSLATASTVPGSDVALAPDLAIDETPSPGNHVTDTIAVNLRPWGDARSTRTRLSQLTQAIERLRDEGSVDRVVGVPLSVSSHAATDDRRAIAPLLRALRGVDASMLDPVSARDVEQALGSAGAVITMRLHGAVLARNRLTPCVALGYDPKIEEVAEPMGAVTVPLTAPGAEIVHSLDHARSHAGNWTPTGGFAAVDRQIRSITHAAESTQPSSTATLSNLEAWRIALGV